MEVSVNTNQNSHECANTTFNFNDGAGTSCNVANVEASIDIDIEELPQQPTSSLLETEVLEVWMKKHYHPHSR